MLARTRVVRENRHAQLLKSSRRLWDAIRADFRIVGGLQDNAWSHAEEMGQKTAAGACVGRWKPTNFPPLVSQCIWAHVLWSTINKADCRLGPYRLTLYARYMALSDVVSHTGHPPRLTPNGKGRPQDIPIYTSHVLRLPLVRHYCLLLAYVECARFLRYDQVSLHIVDRLVHLSLTLPFGAHEPELLPSLPLPLLAGCAWDIGPALLESLGVVR